MEYLTYTRHYIRTIEHIISIAFMLSNVFFFSFFPHLWESFGAQSSIFTEPVLFILILIKKSVYALHDLTAVSIKYRHID